MATSPMTDARAEEICSTHNTTKEKLWDRYVDERIENRKTMPPAKAVQAATEKLATELNISPEESMQLYQLLYEEML